MTSIHADPPFADPPQPRDPDYPEHPNGAACRDCAHFDRFCRWFLHVEDQGSHRVCDWSPSRFQLPVVPND